MAKNTDVPPFDVQLTYSYIKIYLQGCLAVSIDRHDFLHLQGWVETPVEFDIIFYGRQKDVVLQLQDFELFKALLGKLDYELFS